MGAPRLHVGIVGAGFIGTVHARAARLAGATVAGVAASTPEHAAQAATALGAARPFADAEALIESPDIDVVHVCTPNGLHRAQVAAALAAGKHVVCEKPLAVDLDGAAALTSAAAHAGLVATVPFVYRFYPMVREARARARRGGPARLIYGNYLQDWLSTEHDYNWRVDASAGGRSRAFADIGSHWCDLVEFVTGDRITHLAAELVTAIPVRQAAAHRHAFAAGSDAAGARVPVDTEDAALVTFRTAGGAAGSVVISQISSGRKNQLRFEIAGPDETLAFDQEHPDSLWIGRRAPSLVATRDAEHLDPSAAAYVTVPAGHPQGYQECFDAFVADTYRAISAGSVEAIDGLPTFADGLRSAELIDAVLRASATGSWVAISREEGNS